MNTYIFLVYLTFLNTFSVSIKSGPSCWKENDYWFRALDERMSIGPLENILPLIKDMTIYYNQNCQIFFYFFWASKKSEVGVCVMKFEAYN